MGGRVKEVGGRVKEVDVSVCRGNGRSEDHI